MPDKQEPTERLRWLESDLIGELYAQQYGATIHALPQDTLPVFCMIDVLLKTLIRWATVLAWMPSQVARILNRGKECSSEC